MAKLKILVVIASYGDKNERCLARVIEEYRSAPFDVDMVVLSNIEKNLAPDIELRVGLPNKNPWSLPFAHQQIFADRWNDYDLFIYSEDDILITEKNITAFLRSSEVLAENEAVGFFIKEISPQGFSFPQAHGPYHWDPGSVRWRGDYCFAFFSNEHSACYALTRAQLKRAIDSGGYLVEPHEGKYDLLCSAATDPYTQCGFAKLIPISHLDDFLVHHLPNKYVGRLGVGEAEMRRQVNVLLKIAENGHRPGLLFRTETPLGLTFCKDYYEPIRPELVAAIPKDARRVLSLGCGWGATEGQLVQRGHHVVAIPLDPVIAGSAEARGVEIVHADLQTVKEKLAGEKFDCLMLSEVLHLVKDPVQLLVTLTSFLQKGATVVAVAPNMYEWRVLWKLFRKAGYWQDLSNYEKVGAHSASRWALHRWLRDAGLRLETTITVSSPRAQRISRLTLGLLDSFLGYEFIAVAKQN